MKTLTLVFEREKATKNTVRFRERVEGSREPMVGTLYVQKAADVGSVDVLRVTIEPLEEVR